MLKALNERFKGSVRKGRRFAAGMIMATALTAPIVAQAAPQGEIVMAAPILRQHFDPTSMIAVTDYLVYGLMYDGLLNLGPKGKYPALATSWKISPDGKQIDFELRKGVKFQNGDPFTAEDVKFTYEALIKPGNTHSYRKGFVDSLDHVEVVDPLHVRFHLKEPWPGFFTNARYALQPIVPKNYYEKVGAKGFEEKPIGTGPFKLVDTKAGEWSKFEANPNYWGDVPKVKVVTQRLVKEQFTLYAMLEKGEADIVTGLSGALLERVRNNPKLHLFSSKYVGTSGMYFNKTTFPESKDKRVRLEVCNEMNRAEISKKILTGVCEPAKSIFTPATFGYVDGLSAPGYDPAKAKALLKEAGVAPGKEVTFAMHTESFGSLPNAPQVLEALAGNLEAVGFKVKRVPYETSAWLSMMRGGKQPDIFYGPSSIPDDGGETIAGWYTPKAVWSSGNINVPEYAQIFNEQLKSVDLEKREETLQKFAKLENENRESVPLFWCDSVFAATSRIKDWKPAVGSAYQLNFQSVVLSK